MTAPLQLDESSFDRFVCANPVAVIGFVAGGDGDAAAFVAAAGAVAATHPAAAFGTVAAEQRGLYEMFGLNGSATAIFRERVVLYLEPGIPDAGQLDRLLASIGALDIRKVHAEIEQQRQAEISLAALRVCPTARRGKLS
jgi:hypothetical protein